MFTPAARTQVTQLGYQVAPRKSDTATFDIGEVQYIEGGGARVVATWTDLGRTDEMLWLLRSGAEGWRIAGMAATVFPGEPPLLLDFENLEEAMNKIRMLRETIEQRETRLQAQQPVTPQDAVVANRIRVIQTNRVIVHPTAGGASRKLFETKDLKDY